LAIDVCGKAVNKVDVFKLPSPRSCPWTLAPADGCGIGSCSVPRA